MKSIELVEFYLESCLVLLEPAQERIGTRFTRYFGLDVLFGFPGKPIKCRHVGYGDIGDEIVYRLLLTIILTQIERKKKIPCLSATLRCGVLSEDSFISPIFSLQLLLVVALDRSVMTYPLGRPYTCPIYSISASLPTSLLSTGSGVPSPFVCMISRLSFL